jgi:DNA-binding NtrC family response regulator
MAQAQTALASNLPIPIWLHGPAGSGKQEIARGLIAGRSQARGGMPGDPELVVIHCPLMDAPLLEGVLELYRDRATAHGRMPGLILQQLDQLTEQAQAQLLEFFDHHAPDPLITTSRRPPSELSGGYWKRLLAKLAIMTIDLPPLGGRPEDLPSLCAKCLVGAVARGTAKVSPLGLSGACEQLIGAYPWPGNYRELEQVLSAAAAAAVADSASAIEPRHLPLAVRTAGSLASGLGDPTWLKPIVLDDILLEVERTLIERAVEAEPRNRAAAARLLGLSRTRLLRRIEQLGLSAAEPDQSPAE